MDFINTEALRKAGLEMLRVIVLAILPVLIAGLEQGFLNFDVVIIVAVIAGLRFIDKYLHTLGKLTDNKNLIKGLTRI